MPSIPRNFLIVICGGLLVAAFVYSGLVSIAADEEHWIITERIVDLLRTRAVARRSQDIKLPNLDDPRLALRGAGQYAEMCAMCHLAPGIKDTEIRQGLYPRPPNLSERQVDPRAAFWTIKHGIKMSAMPAWGATHDDQTIWSLVAFINRLPQLSPQQYTEMVTKSPVHEMSSTSANQNLEHSSPHTHTHPHESSQHK